MKARSAIKACAAYASPILFALSIYLCRVLALWILSNLFGAWNLNAQTYAYAPAWARALADASGETAQAAALLPAFAVSAAFAIRRKRSAKPLDAVVWVSAGAVAAGAMLGILLALGSARLSHMRYAFSPAVALNAATHIFAAVACAVSARMIPKKGACAIAAFVSSVLGQCALGFVIYGASSAPEFINAALFGVAAYALYDKRASILPEICAASAFLAVSTCVFGFGGAGMLETYTVSEAFLTGGDLGFAGAFATTVFLSCAILIMLYSNKLNVAVARLRKKVR